MTNREVLQSPESVLSALDRQRLFLLRVEGTPAPCPACQQPVNLFEAAGIDPDAYDFGQTRLEYRCPNCGAQLEQLVPFVAIGRFWHWQFRTAWLREQLHRAEAFEQGSETKPE